MTSEIKVQRNGGEVAIRYIEELVADDFVPFHFFSKAKYVGIHEKTKRLIFATERNENNESRRTLLSLSKLDINFCDGELRHNSDHSSKEDYFEEDNPVYTLIGRYLEK